jgi:hypothetical protein
MTTPWPPLLEDPQRRARLAAYDIVEASQLVGLLARPDDRARLAALVGLDDTALKALIDWLAAAGHPLAQVPAAGAVQFDFQAPSPPRGP